LGVRVSRCKTTAVARSRLLSGTCYLSFLASEQRQEHWWPLNRQHELMTQKITITITIQLVTTLKPWYARRGTYSSAVLCLSWQRTKWQTDQGSQRKGIFLEVILPRSWELSTFLFAEKCRPECSRSQ
jgi:hypothetical protein